MLSDAIGFATTKHAPQKRRGSGLPYVVHPLEVLNILLRHGIHDEAVLAAAVLHDVVEDCGVPAAEILDRFGPAVAATVAAVTKPADGPWEDRKRRAHELVRLGPPAARLVKMADRLSNILDLDALEWTSARKAEYLREALEIAQLGADVHAGLSQDLASVARAQLARIAGT